MGTPYRCPVCYGTGTVPADFYSQIGSTTSTARERCRSCWGTGIVWDNSRSISIITDPGPDWPRRPPNTPAHPPNTPAHPFVVCDTETNAI